MKLLCSTALALPTALVAAVAAVAVVVMVAPAARADAWPDARAAFWSQHPDAEQTLHELAQSPVADALTRRDAFHLLGRLYARQGHYDAAADAYREALGLARAPDGSPSALVDVLAYGLAEAASHLPPSREVLDLLTLVEQSPHTALRAEAAFLRARELERLGDLDAAGKTYRAVAERFPDATFGHELRRRMDALGLGGEAKARRPVMLAALADGASASPRVPLAQIRFLLTERRFDLADEALAPWLVEPPADAPKELRALWLDALELELDNAFENFRFDDALATNARLRKNGRRGLSSARETKLFALDGDFDKARAELKKRHRGGRGKAYFEALGDLAYEHGRYAEAYEAYQKSHGKGAPTERMVWCLLRSGKANEAAKHWEKLGRTRGYNKNLVERYWYARAKQLGGKQDAAKELFEHLVEDAPLEYYGLQAWSRLQEMAGTVPEGATPPVLKVPRKNNEPLAGTPTVTWSEASLAGAWDQALKPAPLDEVVPAVERFASAWGEVSAEARRAAELVRLGDLTAATLELRVLDMDLRALRSGASALTTRARSDLLDNRSPPRARGGESMKASLPRKTAEQANAFKRSAGAIRKDLRAVQRLLGDPYGTRRGALEEEGRLTPELLAKRGKEIYPIAYPEVVEPLARQLGVPPYFVYAIMTVESAFHPGAVSVANAFGLVQVIPRTGENLARELGYVDFVPERLLEPSVSIYFGGYYLARLLARFHGQEPLAAAAYNAGPHRMATWLLARGNIPLDMFIEDIPYDQARGYTKTVLEHIAAYRRIYHGEDHYYIRNTIDPTMGDAPNY